MKTRSMVRILSIAILITMLSSACASNKPPSMVNTPGSKLTNTRTPTPTPAEPSSGTPQIPAPSESLNQVETLLKTMTLEEKIGQMFFIASRTDSNGNNLLKLDDTLKGTLKELKPGGFVLFSENIQTIPQTTKFINELQNQAEITLFMAVDEEGGIVTRLNKSEALHATDMPEPYSIGLTRDSQNAFLASKAIAEEIGSLGFNMDFAPVTDIFSNPKNKIIGKRSCGSEQERVSAMVASSGGGGGGAGIIPVLKHFPGHGDTLADSHTGAAVVENNLERLEKVEFKPFKAGIDAGAEVVMTGHLLTPKITDNGLPATLSPEIIQNILRNELGFKGLIITDGLEMSAISAFYSEEEAVVLAVKAGVDMLLLPKDLHKAYNALLDAVKSGEISEERINESVRRILEIKVKYLYNNARPILDPEATLGSQAHRDLADKIRKDSTP
ncbi:MAG: glycoside hydrolase family 3 protein [Clostridia bacterium]|nr:glycoside hydrolase family 3 protein [Clostridia bacterium]